MRSLPKRFWPKETDIEENKDLDKINVEELVGSLQAYESSLPQTNKGKSITLKSAKDQEISDEKNLSTKM